MKHYPRVPNVRLKELAKKFILIVQQKFDDALSVIASLKLRYNKSINVLSDLYYFESIVYDKLKKFNLAFDALTEALWINPAHQEAKGKIWVATELSKKYKQSISLNYFLLKRDHYSAITWFNLAHAYYSEGKYKKAIEAFDFCKIINEDFISAYLDVAEVCMILGLYQKAGQNLKIAIEKFELNELEIFIQYGESLFKLGESRLAREVFLKGMEIDPLDPDLLYLIGETFRVENNFCDAVSNYELALEIDAERDDVYRNLGRINFLMGEFDSAKENFEKAINLNPAESEYRSELASYYLNIGELWDAEIVLAEARKEIENVKLDYHYGAILILLDKEKMALEVFANALQTDFNHYSEIFEFAPELENNPQVDSIINYYKK